MRRHGRVAWTVAAALLAGCALRAPRQVVPVSADELLEALAARRVAVTSLRARARVRAGLAGLWTREALVVRRPNGVRIDVLSPFGLTLALGTEGSTLWAYSPSTATRYEGPATPSNLARFLGAPLAVRDLVDILLGLPPWRAPAGHPQLEATRDGEYRLQVPLEDEGTQTMWFALDTHALRRAEELRDGVPVLRVSFADYRDGFPRTLEVSAPATGAAAELAYDAVEPNASFDSSLFAPPPAPQVLPLEAAPR